MRNGPAQPALPLPFAPVRVGIDARCLNAGHIGGMGKYVQEILHRVASHEIEWSFFSDTPHTELRLPPGVSGHTDKFQLKGCRFHTWEQIGLPWRAWQADVDVLHCTTNTLPFWQPTPAVVTIHDTILWQPRKLNDFSRWYLWGLVPRALKKCACIITVSESSRSDILALWPSLEEKTRLIPHGIHERYFAAPNGRANVRLRQMIGTGPYLLYVGGTSERKRFPWACDVFDRLDIPELRMIACGFDDEERADVLKALRPDLRDRISLPAFIQEDDMPDLYRNAVAVLYPTLYEGFGFPALEAQAVGTPVLFSELASLKELKGPAAEVLGPDDMDSWTGTCRRLFLERAANPIQNQASRLWAGKFSWEVSAARHLDIYKSVSRRKVRT